MAKKKVLRLEGMPDELREALRELGEHLGVDDSDKLKIELGTLSPELIAIMNKIEHDAEDLKEEVHRKMKDAVKEIERDYEPKMMELKKRDRAFWEEIYRKFGSQEGKHHSINRITGVVSVEPDDDPTTLPKFMQ